MNVLVIGGDGYCGWATSLYLSSRGHDVTIMDSLVRRDWDREHGLDSLVPIASMRRRIGEWHRLTGRTIRFEEADVTDYDALHRIVHDLVPDAVVHFGQQRSAPFSMIDREHAMRTHLNNTVGNMNVLWALHECAPQAHLVKLGTMGEYGTPNIDIEEGFIDDRAQRPQRPAPVPEAARLVLPPDEGQRQRPDLLRVPRVEIARDGPEPRRRVRHAHGRRPRCLRRSRTATTTTTSSARC